MFPTPHLEGLGQAVTAWSAASSGSGSPTSCPPFLPYKLTQCECLADFLLSSAGGAGPLEVQTGDPFPSLWMQAVGSPASHSEEMTSRSPRPLVELAPSLEWYTVIL